MGVNLVICSPKSFTFFRNIDVLDPEPVIYGQVRNLDLDLRFKMVLSINRLFGPV